MVFIALLLVFDTIALSVVALQVKPTLTTTQTTTQPIQETLSTSQQKVKIVQETSEEVLEPTKEKLSDTAVVTLSVNVLKRK